MVFCNTNQIIWHCVSPFEFYGIPLYQSCPQLRNIWYFRKFAHAHFVIYQTIAAIYDWQMSNQPQMRFGKCCAVFNETKSIDIFYVSTVLFDIRRGQWNTNWDCMWKKWYRISMKFLQKSYEFKQDMASIWPWEKYLHISNGNIVLSI